MHSAACEKNNIVDVPNETKDVGPHFVFEFAVAANEEIS